MHRRAFLASLITLFTLPRGGIPRQLTGAELAQVARLAAMRFTREQIAAEMGVPVESVKTALREIRREWMDTKAQSFNEYLGREIAATDEVSRQAWAAYFRTGDSKWLEIVNRCAARRLRLLGLAARKIA